MGRGLAAILAASPREAPEELRELPLDLITPNPDQPRHSFDEDTLLGLADSIRVRGVLQPVLVRPVAGGSFELIAGERRWRAAGLAERETIPAIVREHDDATTLEIALVENMAREDLNPIEEARACAALVEELGLTREEVGLRVGRSRVAVSNLIRLLDLPDDAIALIETGDLSEGHGRALLLADDHAVRRGLAKQAVASGWSVRVLEARARSVNEDALATRRRKPAGGGSGPRRTAIHPDQLAAAEEIAQALGGALGADVEVSPASSGGYTAALSFETLDEALEFAERLADRRPAAARH
jgi:ParB family chromosome partitioning protein